MGCKIIFRVDWRRLVDKLHYFKGNHAILRCNIRVVVKNEVTNLNANSSNEANDAKKSKTFVKFAQFAPFALKTPLVFERITYVFIHHHIIPSNHNCLTS